MEQISKKSKNPTSGKRLNFKLTKNEKIHDVIVTSDSYNDKKYVL